MRIGVPKEIKNHEYRVGLVPAGVRELVASGHQVLVQSTAGAGIGVEDAAYVAAGAKIVATAKEVFDGADLVVKVKEPQLAECKMLRPGQVLFTYLHLAADAAQANALMASGATAIAYETVTAPEWLAAAAHADERSRRPYVGAGRRRFVAEGERWPGCVARWRAGRAAGEGRRAGWWCFRHRCGGNRCWHARRCDGRRSFAEALARAGCAVRWPLEDRCFHGRSHRVAGDAGGSGHRRRVGGRRRGAEAGDARHGEQDEEGRGDGGYFHRPGRLLRNQQADHARRADVRGRWRRALLRDEHAGRRAAHFDVRAHERDAAVCEAAGRSRCGEGARGRSASGCWLECACWRDHAARRWLAI